MHESNVIKISEMEAEIFTIWWIFGHEVHKPDASLSE